MLWLYIELTQLTLDAWLNLASTEPRQPTVVYTNHHNRILQCCPLAQQKGIVMGMGIAEAVSLCSDLKVLHYKISEEEKHLTDIANGLYKLASDIVIDKPTGLVLRIDNLVNYYKEYNILWTCVETLLRQYKVNYNYASGYNIDVARVLAKAHKNILYTNTNAIKQALTTCVLEYTTLDNKTKQQLHRVGIVTVGDLFKITTTELGKRFKNDVIFYLASLKGETLPRYTTYTPPDRFQRRVEPHYEISNTTQLLPWLQTLVKQLELFLTSRNNVTSTLKFTLFLRDQAALLLQVNAATPLYRYQDWESLIQLKLETLVLHAPVLEIELTTGDIQILTEQSNDFFGHRHNQFAELQLLAQLRTKLGEDCVLSPYLRPDHRLEATPVEQSRINCTQDSKQAMATSDLTSQPAFYTVTPSPLTEHADILYGPIRIDTGWWDNQAIKRDYYILKTEQGAYLYAFRDQQSQWFVQGWFS